MTIKKIQSPYSPRDWQKNAHQLANTYRFLAYACHRRAGKSVFTINHIIFSLLKNDKQRPQYAYIAPEKSQTKKIIWDYVKEYTNWLPGVRYYEAELKVEIPLNNNNKGYIFLEGAENPDRLRGMYFDGVVLDEVAQMPKSIWTDVLRPAISDRGGWALFIGTPKGRNYFKELISNKDNPDINQYNEWGSFILKASESGILPEEELRSARITQGEALYQQEYECSFDAVIAGSYYGELLDFAKQDNRIGDFGWNKNYPVFTSWDIGMNDKTSIWFAQQIGNYIYVIDFFEANNKPLPFFANILKSKPYVYEKHIVPHDVAVRSFSTGNTLLDDIVKLLGNNIIKIPKVSIENGINAVRSILPMCYFNDSKCNYGLDCLSNYRSSYNDKNGVQTLTPIHDWTSHASDSFRYLALGIKETKNPIDRYGRHRTKITNYNWNPLK